MNLKHYLCKIIASVALFAISFISVNQLTNSSIISAAENATQKERLQTNENELRGAWISTVYNIDWPSSSRLSVEEQKAEFKNMLDTLHASGINAVFVQVRAASDAIYPSKLVPWSKSLTGTEGMDPGYDPLEFMIKEAHHRGMELHAWFNPFRASTVSQIQSLAQNHPAREHPEWVISHDNKLIFDPGLPEVREHIIDSIMEVVKHYNIDGVHLDDYFYPYGNEAFNDNQSFALYNKNGNTKANWRRNNINTFVEKLNQAIKKEKTGIDFGISPFGIWRNMQDDVTGSDTKGNSAYDNQYADARTWIKNGWIDYIAPQLYWSIGYKVADYAKLVEWWSNETKNTGVKLYIGHAAYKVGSNNTDWKSSDEIIQQLQLNKKYPEVNGSIFFSAKSLLNNTANIGDKLTAFYKANPIGGSSNHINKNIRVKLNNTEVSFPDALPYIDNNNRVQVPVRFIAESLFFDVNWNQNQQSKTVTLMHNDLQVTLIIGEKLATVNGNPIMMDTSAVITRDRTYVPLRFLSELAGMKIVWEEASNTVNLIHIEDSYY